ncbi:LrgB family protein [Serpentinicella sp. ANB-PHB4]|nr:LrgB family protein [Serpentinicella sp. ANB-PHB4]MDR5658752.1 LrgB family protein [Serpentinicella sp. ANB-PHB4]
MVMFDSPYFGLVISILFFELGIIINKKTKIAILNPLLISIIAIIGVLQFFDIDFETYNQGGSLISFLLGPATVVLAVPLYKQIKLVKKNFVSILFGILLGSSSAVISTWYLSSWFGLSEEIRLSLVPKSVTTPIGIEISDSIGGIPSITIVGIVIAGILGAVIGPYVLKLFKIDDPIAVGISFGTSSHGMGTTKAIELGETEGAMSGIAIGIAGLISVMIIPIILKFIT